MTTTQLDQDKLSRPGTADYDDLCASWNARVQQHPEVAFAPTSSDEIVAAVRFAAAAGMTVRVQATGHGASEACANGLLVNTSGLRGVTVEPASETAVIEAGTKWIDVIKAAYPHALAPICGSSSDVGAVGFSLGGGTGWLVRPYGLACDAIEAAEIVTADGVLRWVDGDREPELFWALRGGGPNLGIVSRMRIRLVPAAEVYAGSMIWPVEQAATVLPAWRDWVRGVPTEMTSTFTVMHMPEAPFVPEPMRGKSFAVLMTCYSGDPEDGVALVEPLRSLPGMLMDQVGPLPFTSIDQVSQDPVEPLPHALWSTMLRDLTDDAIAELVAIAPRGVEPYTILEVRHVGGGVPPAPDERGLAHWSGDFLVATIAVTPDQRAWAASQDMATRLTAGFRDASTGMAPLNFLDSPRHIGQAFSREHLERLRAVKHRYDPADMFGGDRSVEA